jgi:hypothetical protein
MPFRILQWVVLVAVGMTLYTSDAWTSESVQSVILRDVEIKVGDYKKRIFEAIGNEYLVGEQKGTDFRLVREYYWVDGQLITFDFKYPLTITAITVDDPRVSKHVQRPLCSATANGTSYRSTGWYGYAGTIAGKKVSLYLHMTSSDRVEGVYEYEQYRKPIRVTAWISPNGREIQLDELNEKAQTRATFWGQFRPWKPGSSPNLSCDWIVGVWRREASDDGFAAFELRLHSIGWKPPDNLLSAMPDAR